MKLILCTHDGFGAWFLRVWMWSKFSHSAIYDPETDTVTDSTFWGGGVRETSLQEFFTRYSVHEFRETGITDIINARTWLKAQLNKKYDWTALFGILVHRNWAEPDSWFCSELTETAITLFGKPRFSEQAYRITPYHQAMLYEQPN